MFKLLKRKEKEIIVDDTQKKEIINENYKSFGYESAQQNNSNIPWDTSYRNPTSIIADEGDSIRNRARNLARNDSLTKRFIDMYCRNVVSDDFKIKLPLKNENGELLINKINCILDAWEDWKKSENCDVTGRNSFVDNLNLIATSYLIDGESIINHIKDKKNKDNKYGYQLQLIDAVRLQYQYYSNDVVASVKVNKYNRVIGYYVAKPEDIFNQYNYTEFGGGLTNDVDYIKASDLIHFYKQDFVGQIRGVSYFASVMNDIKALSEFNTACLYAAKIGASSSIYLERDAEVKNNQIASGKDVNDNYFSKIGIGIIKMLPKGVKMKSFDAKYPDAVFSQFNKFMIQKIAGGLGISPVFLANMTDDLNYSTSITISAEDRQFYINEQNKFIEKIILPIFKNWLEQAILNNCLFYKKGNINSLITIDDFDEIINNIKFSGKRWPYRDLNKEADANSKNLSSGVTTKTEILEDKGRTYEDILIEKNHEKYLEELYGFKDDNKENVV